MKERKLTLYRNGVEANSTVLHYSDKRGKELSPGEAFLKEIDAIWDRVLASRKKNA